MTPGELSIRQRMNEKANWIADAFKSIGEKSNTKINRAIRKGTKRETVLLKRWGR